MEFVDTNILLYSVSGRTEDDAKMRAANALLAARDIALSAQVLQEFYWQATHAKGNVQLSHSDAADVVRSLARQPVQELTAELVVAAIATSRRFEISYWDGAIIEAARALGCTTVLTEDLNDGQDYGGVRVENPFRDV